MWSWDTTWLPTLALTRIMLLISQAHNTLYLSDVLAAIAESIAWLALCLTAINTLQRYRSANRDEGMI